MRVNAYPASFEGVMPVWRMPAELSRREVGQTVSVQGASATLVTVLPSPSSWPNWHRLR